MPKPARPDRLVRVEALEGRRLFAVALPGVAKAGAYTRSFRVASRGNGGTFRELVGGADVSGPGA